MRVPASAPIALLLALLLPVTAAAAADKKLYTVEDAPKEPYRLRIADEVEIIVGGHVADAVKVPVAEDGTVLHPLAGAVPAAGQTIRELEVAVEKMLTSLPQQQLLQVQAEQTTEELSSSSEVLTPKEVVDQIYQLQVGDQLDIMVWEHPELSQKIQIRDDGSFAYPLLGNLQAAAGRSTGELETEIRDRLNESYLVNPQVNVRLINAQFTILGQTENSGFYPIEGSMDLMSAISKAGDVLTLRSSRIEILRRAGDQQVIIRTNVNQLLSGRAPNIPVLPRDTIYMKVLEKPATLENLKVAIRISNAKFTTLGEVNNPGAYAIEGSVDLLAAISLAGGISKFGSSKVEVIRTVGDQKIVIRANIERILRGKSANLTIQPHDTIYARRRLF